MSRDRMQSNIPEYIRNLTKRVADLEQLVRDYIELDDIMPLEKHKDDVRDVMEVQWRAKRRMLKDRARAIGHILQEEEPMEN